MEATIIKQDKQITIIEFDSDIGHGRLEFKYISDGRYELNAEYLSMETVIKIIKSIK